MDGCRCSRLPTTFLLHLLLPRGSPAKVPAVNGRGQHLKLVFRPSHLRQIGRGPPTVSPGPLGEAASGGFHIAFETQTFLSKDRHRLLSGADVGACQQCNSVTRVKTCLELNLTDPCGSGDTRNCLWLLGRLPVLSTGGQALTQAFGLAEFYSLRPNPPSKTS